MIFLMCGVTYVKVAHWVLFLDSVGDVAWDIFCCICWFNLIIRFLGEIVALCDPQYNIPFVVLISFVKGETEHTFDVICKLLFVNSSFLKEAEENCALLGYYVACSGNFLATFRGILPIPSPRVKIPKKKAGNQPTKS
jgi:hypothetical protein